MQEGQECDRYQTRVDGVLKHKSVYDDVSEVVCWLSNIWRGHVQTRNHCKARGR